MAIFKKPAAIYSGSDMLTLIGPEAFFHGSITVRGSIRIEGEMEGNITEAQDVVVGKGGRVRGNVSGERVEVGGQVVGDIVCSVHFELKSTGKVLGNIRAPKILIEDGAVFDGNCTMAEADSLQGVPQAAAALGNVPRGQLSPKDAGGKGSTSSPPVLGEHISPGVVGGARGA